LTGAAERGASSTVIVFRRIIVPAIASIAALGFGACATLSSVEPVEPPADASFDTGLVAMGAARGTRQLRHLSCGRWTPATAAVAFDAARVTSVDWASYPMIRFPDLPDSVDVHLIDRPGQPFLGTGEAAQGPTAAAVENAVADATGVRIRELPVNRSRVRAAAGP
jgi:hypothetical protein